ncbi:MAG: DUF2007 domain-containing protein [Anaerolineae bacterium]
MDSQWKIILETSNMMEAEVVAGRLQSEGIEARIHQEPAGQALGLTVGLLGETVVLVPEADYEAAVAILETQVPQEDVTEE